MSESRDLTYHSQVDPITSDKRDRIIEMTALRRVVLKLDVAEPGRVLRLKGDFLWASPDSSGAVNIQLNNTSEDPIPFFATAQLAGIPIKDVVVSWVAQPNQLLYLWYGYQGRFQPSSQVQIAQTSAQQAFGLDFRSALGKTFWGAASVAAVAAQNGYVQIFNPAGSGIVVYVDAYYAQENTAAERLSWLQDTVQFGGGFSVQSKLLGGASFAKLSGVSLAAAPGSSSGLIPVGFLPATGYLRVPITPSIPLNPGTGVELQGGVQNNPLTAGFEWREY